MCAHSAAAESVCLAGLTQHVCLNLQRIYTQHASLAQLPGTATRDARKVNEGEGVTKCYFSIAIIALWSVHDDYLHKWCH